MGFNFYLLKRHNNTQIANAKDIDIIMPMYNSIRYGDNYSKTSESLWHYNRDEPFLQNDAMVDFATNNNNSASFNFKTKIAGRTNNGIKNVKIRVPLMHLSNFRRTLEMPLNNCETNLFLTWSGGCFIIDIPIDDQVPTLQ